MGQTHREGADGQLHPTHRIEMDRFRFWDFLDKLLDRFRADRLENFAIFFENC